MSNVSPLLHFRVVGASPRDNVSSRVFSRSSDPSRPLVPQAESLALAIYTNTGPSFPSKFDSRRPSSSIAQVGQKHKELGQADKFRERPI